MNAMIDIFASFEAYYAPRRSRHADRLVRCLEQRYCSARHDDMIPAGGGSGGESRARSVTTGAAPATKSSGDGDGGDPDPEPARRPHSTPAERRTNVAPMFFDLATVAEVVALSTGGIQALVRKGDFPKPRALSSRRVGWLVREVEEWANARPIADMLPPANAGQRRAI